MAVGVLVPLGHPSCSVPAFLQSCLGSGPPGPHLRLHSPQGLPPQDGPPARPLGSSLLLLPCQPPWLLLSPLRPSTARRVLERHQQGPDAPVRLCRDACARACVSVRGLCVPGKCTGTPHVRPPASVRWAVAIGVRRGVSREHVPEPVESWVCVHVCGGACPCGDSAVLPWGSLCSWGGPASRPPCQAAECPEKGELWGQGGQSLSSAAWRREDVGTWGRGDVGTWGRGSEVACSSPQGRAPSSTVLGHLLPSPVWP